MQKILIRPFQKEDLQKVVWINRTCLPENYPPLFFLSIYESFPNTFIVAENVNNGVAEGEIVGYVMGRVERGFSNFKNYRLTKKGHIVSIAVIEKYRRRGIATQLMQEALEGFRGYGASECFLEVRASNTPAITLYRKLGYTDKKVLPGYYRDGEDALLLACPL